MSRPRRGHAPGDPGGRWVELETLRTVWEYVVHMDVYLAQLVESLGAWVYVLVFLVIFLETGVVIAPWLPGESLLIASGSLAGSGYLNILILGPLLFVAAFLGDLSNYLIGRFVGRRVMAKPRRYLRADHVAQAHEFYEKYGGRAIVFARFMPVVRTLAPFVAGAARMDLHRFLLFDGIASLTWVTIFVGAGYWFGSIPWVRDNLALMLLGVVLLSITPSLIGLAVKRVRMRRARRFAMLRGVSPGEPAPGEGADGPLQAGPLVLDESPDTPDPATAPPRGDRQHPPDPYSGLGRDEEPID